MKTRFKVPKVAPIVAVMPFNTAVPKMAGELKELLEDDSEHRNSRYIRLVSFVHSS